MGPRASGVPSAGSSPESCGPPAVIDGGTADPLALRQVSRDLTPFYCPDCQLNYCARDWSTYVLVDEGFYDCTMGTCPNGHRHVVDD